MPTMLGDGRLHTFGEMCLEESVSATFIPTHQARITNHVYGDNSGKSALFAGQRRFLPLAHHDHRKGARAGQQPLADRLEPTSSGSMAQPVCRLPIGMMLKQDRLVMTERIVPAAAQSLLT